MISVKVVQLNPNRLAKIRRELNYVTTSDFLKTVPTASFERRVLDYIKSVSPSGTSQYKAYLNSLGLVTDKMGQFRSFKESWRIGRKSEGTRILFNLWSVLNTIGGKVGQAKFKAVEFGSTASDWIAKRSFKFKSFEGWIYIKQGRSVHHAANEGAEAQSKTLSFIRTVMIPEMRASVEANIARRLA